MTGWASGTGFDVHSITSAPGFLNASGNFSLATDFKRSSYPANGRGGSYPSVMGAYITGNETIGYTTTGSGATHPAAPRGLFVQ